jgi:hypothetical protein
MNAYCAVASPVPSAFGYQENDPAAPLASALTLSDASAHLTSAHVSLSGQFAGDGDVLAADVTGTAITAHREQRTCRDVLIVRRREIRKTKLRLSVTTAFVTATVMLVTCG